MLQLRTQTLYSRVKARLLSFKSTLQPPEINIFDAVIKNDVDLVRSAANASDCINSIRIDGVTPLILAASLRLTEVVRTLLELGADPKIPSAEGWIAYDFAYNQGDLSLINLLQERPSMTSNEDDRTSLDLDVFLDHSELVLPKKSFQAYSQWLQANLKATEVEAIQKQLEKTNYRSLLKQLYSGEALSCAHFANNNFLSLHAPMSIGSYEVPMAKRRKIDLVELHQQKFAITEQLLDKLLPDSIFDHKPTHICEIGGAWGATIKYFMDRFTIKEYQNYEPDTAYAEWAAARFGVKKMPVDGESLSGTEDNSMDIVIANNVFIFVPVLKIWSYLTEMRRVIKKNGLIIFNAVVSDQRTDEDLKNYLIHFFPKRALCLLPRDLIDRTFPQPQFEVVQIFDREYFIIKRMF